MNTFRGIFTKLTLYKNKLAINFVVAGLCMLKSQLLFQLCLAVYCYICRSNLVEDICISIQCFACSWNLEHFLFYIFVPKLPSEILVICQIYLYFIHQWLMTQDRCLQHTYLEIHCVAFKGDHFDYCLSAFLWHQFKLLPANVTNCYLLKVFLKWYITLMR